MSENGSFSAGELKLTAIQPQLPGQFDNMSATRREAVEEGLAVLQKRKDTWVATGIGERTAILQDIMQNVLRVADRWVALSLAAKGTSGDRFAGAEEWVQVATVLRSLRLLRQSLLEIQEHGRPRIARGLTTRPDGQVVARVFPQSRIEAMLFKGVSGEVWMEPGVTPEETIDMQAFPYRDKNHTGRVALVLGAGNASPLPLEDLLHKLFVEDQVVVLKFHPVNSYLGPLIEDAFRPLIDRGFLRIVYGGIEQSSYLCYHPSVDEIHLTGSDKTFEAIVFGSGVEAEKRKAERTPLIAKRFTCELGNVGPVIIVPGPWDEGDIREQARHLASWLVANAGYGCLTPRVIIQHRAWSHRHALVEAIGHVLQSIDTRKAYYPGAKERHALFTAAHPEAQRFGRATADNLPWTLISNVDPSDRGDICFRRESFCSLVAETSLEASSPDQYVERAVQFANDTLWGNLNATMIVHPKSLADPTLAGAVDHAIAELRYGTVTVNLFSYYSAYIGTTPWGAFPGQDIYDIQSGIGKTFNRLMFHRPQKSVVRAPFRRMDPVTATSKRPVGFAKKLARFEASPAISKLPCLFWSALCS